MDVCEIKITGFSYQTWIEVELFCIYQLKQLYSSYFIKKGDKVQREMLEQPLKKVQKK